MAKAKSNDIRRHMLMADGWRVLPHFGESGALHAVSNNFKEARP